MGVEDIVCLEDHTFRFGNYVDARKAIICTLPNLTQLPNINIVNNFVLTSAVSRYWKPNAG
jgi:hypothetical protein